MTPPPGWRLEIHEELPSTQDACVARAEAGEMPGLAILARRQSAGRGSRGRGWSEPPAGNLAVTLLLAPEPLPEAVGAWPFVSALALHEALSERGRLAGPMLKWPNDVMLGGRKLAGILIERGVSEREAGGGRPWLAIGFGANLAAAPAVPGREVACLAELGAPPPPELVAVRLMAALDRWRGIWRDEGFGAVRRGWEERAHPRGTALVVRDPRGQVEGSFAGIAEDGALLLETADGIRRFATGEVLSAPGP